MGSSAFYSCHQTVAYCSTTQHSVAQLRLSINLLQKITTDVTGNDTAGMVAGMVASGVTAKGLNGIEAEANKLDRKSVV